MLIYNILGYEDAIMDLLVRTFNNTDIDFQTPDLNFSFSPSNEKLLQCFLLLKCWILLKLRCESANVDGKHSNSSSFWLAVWPLLRRMLDTIDPSALFQVRFTLKRKTHTNF